MPSSESLIDMASPENPAPTIATSTSAGRVLARVSVVGASRVVMSNLHYRNLRFCNLWVTMATRVPARMTAEARREQLLDVAKAIVVDRGFHAVSIEAVARDAGISRPIVYGHFQDLDGVLEALVAREGRRALQQL